jgi:transcriptional regulator with GAF, ATPase, and Fis domain
MTDLDLTKDLQKLVALAAEDDGVDDLLRRGLDWLARIVPYDLAVMFLLEDGKLVARAARGPLAGPTVRHHEIALDDFPTIREALDTRRARAFTEHDHAHGDGDPFDGVLDFPHGHSCMVVPLCAGDRCHGILTLDRKVCEPYPETTVSLVEVYGQVLAIAIRGAEERQALARLHQQDHDRAKLLEAELAGEPAEELDRFRSAAMRDVVRRAHQVADTDTPVLILGETGTGKERLARAIHRWSKRADHPFVSINCAAIPAGLLESELFGHVRGAFTGAARDRAGRFQMANGGTLFLDEIGELPTDLQAKLLRALQEGTFEPVGSDKTIRVDVRILAATHVDLARAMAERRFREDLYYRLSVFPIALPPLRQRLDDLAFLVSSLLADQARRTGRKGMKASADALEKLAAYPWPGNIRELANLLERATITASGKVLHASDLDLSDVRVTPPPPDPTPGVLTLDDVQRQHIERTLTLTGGRIYGERGAAALLGLKPSTLQSRMQKLGVRRLPTGAA